MRTSLTRAIVAIMLSTILIGHNEQVNAQQPSSQSARFILFLKKINDARNNLEWGLDTVTALREKDDPPARPLPFSLEDKITEMERDARLLKAVEFAVSVPEIGGNVPQQKDSRRHYLSRKTNELKVAIYEYERLQSDIANLNTLADELSDVQMIMLRVSEVFLEAARYVPLPVLQQSFVSSWFNIQVDYAPRISSIASDIKDLARTSINRSHERKDVLRNAATPILAALEEEQSEVEAESSKLIERRYKYERDVESLEVQKEEKRTLDIRIQAREMDIQTIQGSIDETSRLIRETQSRITRLNTSIGGKQRALRKKYSYCPNNYTYDSCNHDDAKRRWRNHRRNLRQDLNNYTDQLNAAQSDIRYHNAQLSEAQAQLRFNQQQLQEHKNEAELLARDIDNETTRLRDVFSKLWEDLWRSRTTEIFQASFEDKYDIQESLARLN